MLALSSSGASEAFAFAASLIACFAASDRPARFVPLGVNFAGEAEVGEEAAAVNGDECGTGSSLVESLTGDFEEDAIGRDADDRGVVGSFVK